MTSKQLERKVKQLYSRRRLIETVESLEEAIKAFMTMEGKEEIRTAEIHHQAGGRGTGHLSQTSNPPESTHIQIHRKGGT